MTGRNVSFQPKQGLQLWFGRFLQNTSHEFAQGVALDFTQNHLSSVVRCCFLSTSSCLRSFWVWICDAQHSFYQIYDNYRLHAQLFNQMFVSVVVSLQVVCECTLTPKFINHVDWEPCNGKTVPKQLSWANTKCYLNFRCFKFDYFGSDWRTASVHQTVFGNYNLLDWATVSTMHAVYAPSSLFRFCTATTERSEKQRKVKKKCFFLFFCVFDFCTAMECGENQWKMKKKIVFVVFLCFWVLGGGAIPPETMKNEKKLFLFFFCVFEY